MCLCAMHSPCTVDFIAISRLLALWIWPLDVGRVDTVCFINLLFLHLYLHILNVCRVTFSISKKMLRYFLLLTTSIDGIRRFSLFFFVLSFGRCVEIHCRIFVRHNARFSVLCDACILLWCTINGLLCDRFIVCNFLCHLSTMETCTSDMQIQILMRSTHTHTQRIKEVTKTVN